MYEYFDVFMKLCQSFDDCILVFKMQKIYIMKKYRVLQLGLQLDFLVATDICCCNPSLELATKAKACKGAGQEECERV
jgi:hypothetical protein